ncbi:unnamed protein product [Musa acuminata subsp. burmannicoides]
MMVGETHGRRISRARSQVERERDWGEHAQLALLYVHLLRSAPPLVGCSRDGEGEFFIVLQSDEMDRCG